MFIELNLDHLLCNFNICLVYLAGGFLLVLMRINSLHLYYYYLEGLLLELMVYIGYVLRLYVKGMSLELMVINRLHLHDYIMKVSC